MDNIKDVFTHIYLKNKRSIENNEINSWKSKVSVSGLGSDIENNRFLIKELPNVLRKYGVKKFLDLPCGDFNWMQNVDLTDFEYLGADIVDDIIQSNNQKYPNYKFETIDLIKDKLPSFDLIMVRDCFIHLSDDSIFKALWNIKRSGIKYLLTTTFTNISNNDILDGGYRRINILSEPFNMIPTMMFNEQSLEPFTKNKYLALIETSSYEY